MVFGAGKTNLNKLMIKNFLFLVLIFFLINCSKEKKKAISTFANQWEMKPFVNGCCTFSTLLQLDENKKFSFYYLNNQGDYRTEDFCKGNYEISRDSTIILKPDKHSSNTDFGYDTKEFFNKKLKFVSGNIVTDSKIIYKKIDFSKFDSVNISRYDFGYQNYMNEEISISKNGLLRYSKDIYIKDKLIVTKDSVQLSKNQRLEITKQLNNNFLIQKHKESESSGNSFAIQFSNAEISGSLNPNLSNFFYNTVRDWAK